MYYPKNRQVIATKDPCEAKGGKQSSTTFPQLFSLNIYSQNNKGQKKKILDKRSSSNGLHWEVFVTVMIRFCSKS